MSALAKNSTRSVAVLGLVLLLVPVPFGAQQPDQGASANSLVAAAVALELKDNGRDLHFMYRLNKKTPERTETREALETDAGTVARVLAINNAPLTPEQQQAESARLQEYISTPSKWTRRQKQQQEDANRVRQMVAALPQAFNYTYAGNDAGPDGAQLVRLSFQPNPQWTPPTRELRVYTAMQGIMWLDSASKRLVRIEAKLFRDVDFGWGILGRLYKGGSFQIEQRPLGDGRWETTKTVLDFDGKMLMLKALHIKMTETLSDFRRVPDKISLAEGIKMLQTYDPNKDTVADGLHHQQNGGGTSPQK